MRSRESARQGFFAKVIAKVEQQPKLTEEEIDNRNINELIKLGEMTLIQHIVTYLNTLKDREISHDATRDALDFSLEVLRVAQEKMAEATKIGRLSLSTIMTAWSLISDFKENKDVYVSRANTVVDMFAEIEVTDDTHIIWRALALRLQALHDNTYRNLREDGTLDAGDSIFKSYTGMCKYDMIEPWGRAAAAVENAVARYRNDASCESRAVNKL